MADEYIRRQDAIRLAEQGQVQGFPWQFQMLVRLPPANVAPVVHGEWIHMGCGIFECDKCGKRILTNVYVREEASERFKYCPNCGAKMDKE